MKNFPYVLLIGNICGLVYAVINGNHELTGAMVTALVGLFSTAPHKVGSGS